MKINSTIPNPFFFKPTLSSTNRQWHPATHVNAPRKRRELSSYETVDTLVRKQETVCAVILALCLLASFAVCLTNLAAR